jgi:subtilisin family serine protease
MGQAQGQGFVPGEVLVKIRQRPDVTSRFLERAGSFHSMTLKAAMPRMGLYHYKLAEGDDISRRITQLNAEPDVEFAEPNYYVHKADDGGQPVSIYSAAQVHAMNTTYTSYPLTSAPVNGTATWSYEQTATSSDIPIVAVVDTGVDMTHPVFQQSGAIWTNPNEVINGIDDDKNGYIDDVHGWNYVANSNQMYDDDGHGTHVSGIVTAVGIDIYSDPVPTALVHIMPLKFLDSTGSGTTAAAIQAIDYAISMGANVISNSWGGSSYSLSLDQAIYTAYTQGIVFVAAAGNSSANNDQTPVYPANSTVPNVISVAATDNNDNLASFSDYGATTVHIGAPGLYILSTLPGGYFGTMSGTSMATPYVSGIAALMKRASPAMLSYQIKSIILAQAAPKASLTGLVVANGRANSESSIVAAQSAVVQATQPAFDYSALATRNPSSSSGGGCGLVGKLAHDIADHNHQPPLQPTSWAMLVFLVLFSLPFVLIVRLRATKMREKRRYERFNLDSEVRVTVGERELFGSVKTISMGGVQINTEAMLEKGGMVTMTILGPTGQEFIQVSGEVVWSRSKKAYGVAFSDASLATLDQIESWSKILSKAS